MTRAGSAIGLLLVGTLGCGERQVTDTPPSESPPKVEIDGCQEMRGETCVLRSRPELTLWVGPLAPGAEVEFRVDGRLVVPETQEAVQAGRRFAIVVPSGSGVLEVSGAAWGRQTLAASTWPAWLFAAHQAFANGDAEGARGRLNGCRDPLDEASHAACWTLLAKTLSPSPERDQALEQALRSHRHAHHRFGEVDVATVIIKDRLDRGDLTAAEAHLAALPPPPLPARAELLVTYWRGFAARKRGDVGAALEQLSDAAARAERLGRQADYRAAEEARVLTYEDIGRFETAVQVFANLLEKPPPETPCARASLWNNVGWTRFLAREQGEEVADPVVAFGRAQAELTASGCSPRESFNVAVNHAVALLQAGRIDEAEASLAAAAHHRTAANVEQLWWFALAEARLALAQNERETALARFEALGRLEVPEAAWRARFGRALALGRSAEALAELGAVEALLDERLARLPAREGREWFIAQSEPVVRRQLSLLLEHREDAEALALVRRARARVLRGFAPVDRESALVPSPPTPGELLLAFHPLDDGTWAAFAAESGRPVRAVVVPPPPRPSPDSFAELSRLLLGPFEAEITRSKKVKILPYGPLRKLDFHALPFRGGHLVAALPVAYGLDLGRPRRQRGGGSALVIGDPRGDLLEAEREAREVEAELRRAGHAVTLLLGSQADATTVRRHLALGVEILHFAGHADFAGPGGWQSELRLARGTRLTTADLLALESPPDWVVLSACDSAKTTPAARIDGLGLAQTFLLGGSRAVVATTRPVADDDARPLVRELYRVWLAGGDLAAALAQVQAAELRRGAADSDPAAFRVLEP